jgi:hypothetical protein
MSSLNARAQDPVLEFTSGPGFVITLDGSLGWSFTTNTAITVDSLDAHNPTGTTDDVRLYSTSSLLASATVTTSDPLVGSFLTFNSQSITPVTLDAGQTYYIAEDMAMETTIFRANAAGITTDPSITYDGGVEQAGLGEDPTFDHDSDFAPFEPGFFGPNFGIQAQATGTPEPGSMALALASGIACIGVGMRRIRSRKIRPLADVH